MKYRGWIAFSGFIWAVMGGFLLFKGLKLIALAITRTDSLCARLQTVFGTPQQAATFLILLGLTIGFLKGRFVLSKTVKRVVHRIANLPLPIRLQDAYSKSYWILIGSMMMLGMAFRFLPISVDVRGVIDVAIGSALLNGSMLYFRLGRSIKQLG